MEERGTTEEFKSLDPTIAAWRTEATPTNGSYEDLPPMCDIDNLIPKVLTVIISLIGLAGNTTVLWFLGFRMHRNAFYIYILNLAAADFLFLCLHITVFLKEVIEMFLHITIFTYGIIRTGAIIFYIAGLSMLSAVSTERCLSVLWPIWYRCHRPRHTSGVICALLWALSMVLSILDRVCCLYPNETEKDWCEKVDFTVTAWLIFLLVVLSGSNLALLGRIFFGVQQKPMTRLYVTILLTVFVFLFCGLPFGVYLFPVDWIQNDSDALSCLYLVSLILACVNSTANPIIYFFVGSFRQRLCARNLKRVLERALQDTPEEDEHASSFVQGTLETSGIRVEQ